MPSAAAMLDEDDRVFYDAAKSAGAYLITGNIVCWLNRPFDDLTQERVQFESDAILAILTSPPALPISFRRNFKEVREPV